MINEKEDAMKLRQSLLLVIVLGLILPVMSPQKSAAADFYKGKTIRFVVGLAAWRGL